MSQKLPYIVTDLDGTVVSGEDGSVLHETAVDIAKYQKDSGYRLTFATGRGDIMCREIIDILKIKNPVISYNGALLRDPKSWKVIDVTYMNPDLVYEILMEAYSKGLDIVAYDTDHIIVTPVSKRYRIWTNYNKRAVDDKYKVNFKVYHDVYQMALGAKSNHFKAVKLLIDFDENTDVKVVKAVFDKFKNQIDSTLSGEGLMDYMVKGVSKKQGIIKYADLIKIDPTDIIFFGDNYNDIEAMKFVKTGYAVGNAVEPLKKVATEIIDPVHKNGIGKQLLKIMFIEE